MHCSDLSDQMKDFKTVFGCTQIETNTCLPTTESRIHEARVWRSRGVLVSSRNRMLVVQQARPFPECGLFEANREVQGCQFVPGVEHEDQDGKQEGEERDYE